MLEPNYLQNVGDDLEKLYQELATEILVDIAERIKMNQDAMTSTTEYLNNKLKQLGLQQDWINKRLAEILHTSEEEVDRIMQQSAYKSIRDTFDRLEAGGYDTRGLEFSDQIKKGTSALWGDIQNLTRTTAQLASDTFMRYYDMAYLQVSSGAYSLDQATANTIDKLCREGLTKVSYPSGAQRSIEAAVRLAVRTAVNQNALACEKSVIDELDINLVQTSAHVGARPSHAAWQGKVFWVNHPEGKYENFYEATGYGTGAGLGGWNCRHSFTAYFPGISEDYNKPVNPRENERIYQMEQKQRSYERNMRKWDRERRVKAAAGLDTTKEDYWYKYNKMRLKELVDASNGYLKRDYSAEKIGGTKGRPYKPVRIPKKSIEYKEPDYKEEGSKKKSTKDYRVSWKKIHSPEYKSAFEKITDNKELQETMYQDVKSMLQRNQSTKNEDLYAYDLTTGKRIDFVLSDGGNKRAINETPKFKEKTKAALRAGHTVLFAHNHPGGAIPGTRDLGTLQKKEGNARGVTFGHSGNIYLFDKPDSPITKLDVDVASTKARKYNDLNNCDNETEKRETYLRYLSKIKNFKFEIVMEGEGRYEEEPETIEPD